MCKNILTESGEDPSVVILMHTHALSVLCLSHECLDSKFNQFATTENSSSTLYFVCAELSTRS